MKTNDTGNSETQHILKWDALRGLCAELFVKQGVPEQDAFTVADSLVDADLRGLASHGVSRMTIYMKRLQAGVVKAVFNPKVEDESVSTLALNANNGMGIVAGIYAMEQTVRKAKDAGCCFTTVKRSNHFGTAGYFVREMTKKGMIGFASTNAPPNIAPTGSYRAYLGTNPIAIGAPATREHVILDMAPSIVAMGKVILAAKTGQRIPDGWVITHDGKPTTDAQLGIQGSVLPIGGPKGYGIALFVEILSGILSGAAVGPHIGNLFHQFARPQDVGHVFCAIDIQKFCPLEIFIRRMDEMISEIKSLPRISGISEIFMPGEIEARKKILYMKQGIPVPETVYNELAELAQSNGVAFSL